MAAMMRKGYYIFCYFLSILHIILGTSEITNSSKASLEDEEFLHAANKQQFWLLAEVTNLRWKTACISAQLCAGPKFTISQQMPKYGESMAQDWPLTKTVISEFSLQMFSFWRRGEAQEISIQASVLGTDPKFKFARVCDETPAVFAFQTIDYRREGSRERGTVSEEQERAFVAHLELNGLCFNATLKVQLFRKRCPWCEAQTTMSKNNRNSKADAESMHFQMPGFLHMRTHLLIFLLAIATGVNVFAFLGLLFICIRQFRTQKEFSSRDNSYSSSTPNPGASIEGSPPAISLMASKMMAANAKLGQPHFVPYSSHFSPPKEMAPILGWTARPEDSFRPNPQQQHSNGQHFQPIQSQLLPAIQEEHYDVISDEQHSMGKVKTAGKGGKKKQVRVPQSKQCHHCFLRHLPRPAIDASSAVGPRGNGGQQEDCCSCASFNLEDASVEKPELLANFSCSFSSSSTSTSFSSSASSGNDSAIS